MPLNTAFRAFLIVIYSNFISNMTKKIIYQFYVNVNKFCIRKYLHVLRIIPTIID